MIITTLARASTLILRWAKAALNKQAIARLIGYYAVEEGVLYVVDRVQDNHYPWNSTAYLGGTKTVLGPNALPYAWKPRAQRAYQVKLFNAGMVLWWQQQRRKMARFYSPTMTNQFFDWYFSLAHEDDSFDGMSDGANIGSTDVRTLELRPEEWVARNGITYAHGLLRGVTAWNAAVNYANDGRTQVPFNWEQYLDKGVTSVGSIGNRFMLETYILAKMVPFPKIGESRAAYLNRALNAKPSSLTLYDYAMWHFCQAYGVTASVERVGKKRTKYIRFKFNAYIKGNERAKIDPASEIRIAWIKKGVGETAYNAWFGEGTRMRWD